jgi:outer membrane protein assembly factor BamB
MAADQLCDPMYFFSITYSALLQKPLCEGMVCMLPRQSFEQEASQQMQGVEIVFPHWSSPLPADPVARLHVGPQDFPFLAQIHGHDDEKLVQLATANPSGFPLEKGGIPMLKLRWYVLILSMVLSVGCTSVGTTTPVAPTTTLKLLVPTNTWIRTFEGPNYGAFFDIVLTQDRNILAIGATNHLHLPPYSGDALFVKLTLDGDVIWERTWGGDGYEQAVSVVLAGDGGYYIFGETDSYGAGNRDFFLLKITTDGAEEWFKTYGGARREWPYGMLHLSNEELLIYGFTESIGGGRDEYAIRVTQEGDIIWEYTVENPGEELVLDALETAESDLVLAVNVEEDGQLVKLDANGNIQWAHRYDLPGWQYASRVAQTEDGGFLLAGFSMSSSPRQADTWFARCTSTGELEWETSFGDPSFDDYANSMIHLSDGTYLIGAIANSVLLSRIDEDGKVLWRRSLLDQQTIYGGMALTELEGGDFLVAGLIQLINGRSYDAILLRTDAEGRIGE